MNKRDQIPMTVENIEQQYSKVMASNDYGKEELLLKNILKKYPKNDDLNIIAMKIAVIDITNSTNLAMQKRNLSLYDLAKVILSIPDFDRRLEEGDSELVNIIARNTGAVNLFSLVC